MNTGIAGRRLLTLAGCLLLLCCAGDRGPVILRMAFLGDVMLGRGMARAHPCGWEDALADLPAPLRSAHFTLANLESPFSQERGKETGDALILTAAPESAAALKSAGIDTVSLVNNHSLDGGEAGRRLTRETLVKTGVATVDGDHDPLWLRSTRTDCAVFAWQDVTAALPLESATGKVARAAAGGKCVIVSLHWGNEYQAGPDGRQERMAQAFADAGAWIIWGHHPHVVQPARWLRGAGRSHPTLVLYSLGNALFDQVVPPDARRGAGVLVYLNEEGILRADAVPFVIDPLRGRIVEASAEDAEKIRSRLGTLEHP